MWILQNLLFTLCIALRYVTSAVGVIHVTGYVGNEVNVSCSYGKGYESYEKYLCKNDCGNSDVLIKTSESRKNKYAIHDDRTARIFTTTISDLHSVDAGKYWCGVSRIGKDIYTEVELKLMPDSCCDNMTKLESYEGYSESISCPYEIQYQNNLKYICRGNQPSTCRRQALITSHSRQHGRFRLDDDKVSGKFTVTISNLVKTDSGSYLCGVQRNSDLDVFSAVELEVKEAVHYAAYAVVPVVLLICVLVFIYKYKCYNVRATEAVMSRNTPKAEDVIDADEGGIYGNQEFVVTFKQQSALNHLDDPGGDEPDYENFTTEEFYCNENYHKANRR
ncbi:unnamed protein product [Oreochromis niloticus]|nr:unnamed protein product [Mustela putorius furo]